MASGAFHIDVNGVAWDHWRSHAERTPEHEAIVHLAVDQVPHRWTWHDLMLKASAVAAWLADSGVRKGDVCAVIVRHHKDFYPLYMGVSALGALPTVLAYPNARLHPDKFRQGLDGMCKHSGLDFILTEQGLSETLAPLVSSGESTVKAVLYPMDWLASGHAQARAISEHPPARGDDACLLQHSSGTTGLQKPVVLSHRAILEHIRRYGEAIALDRTDKLVSWLPLYHDMGLIAAFYLPLIAGVPIIQLSPLEWVSAPRLLLEAISRERPTLCWLPNFAYNLMADRIREEDLQGISLDSMRMFINCSEPVRAESHDRFFRKYAAHGLKPQTLAACYAMAETTFAVTQTPPGQSARRLLVDRNELSSGNVVPVADLANGRVCVSSGSAISGCSVRILDEAGEMLPAAKVGELAIHSISLFDGYRNHLEKTAEVLVDGWYRSGDYGFVHDDEYFIVGRKKDLIIIAGNNVFPEDVEDAMGGVPGISPGRVVAFSAENEHSGTDLLCVVAESEAATTTEKQALRQSIIRAGMGIDVTIARVYLVPPRWIIKSSSGKPSRAANKTRALAEVTWK